MCICVSICTCTILKGLRPMPPTRTLNASTPIVSLRFTLLFELNRVEFRSPLLGQLSSSIVLHEHAISLFPTLDCSRNFVVVFRRDCLHNSQTIARLSMQRGLSEPLVQSYTCPQSSSHPSQCSSRLPLRICQATCSINRNVMFSYGLARTHISLPPLFVSFATSILR